MSFSFGNFAMGSVSSAARFSGGMTRGRIQGGNMQGVNYPSPFFDVGHTYLPTTVKQLFKFCRYYFLTNPLINAIIVKLSEYPVTDIIIDHEDPEVVRKWTDYYNDTIRFRSFQIECGLDYHCYGTSAVSLSFPFQKYLTCTSCGFSEQARKIRDYWSYSSHEFRLSCPRCGATGAAIPKDWYYRDASSIRPVRWNVEDIEVSYNDITGECTYFYTMPAPMRADITLGKKDIVEGMPQIFLQAIRQEKGVIFSRANLFTMKRATLAFQDRGWGIPLILPVLKDAFYLQIMKKAQEAILLEHIVPLRILFPQAASGTTDPFTTINLLDWRDQVAMEIARWRHDNNYIPIMPLPLGNQTIGGDGKALLMSQEMQMLGEQIIMGMGVPREFLQGGLSYAGTNVSMRMLENMFLSFIGRQRQMANWVMQMVAHFMGWPKVNVRFKPFKMADDMQRKSYLFQLNQANKISDTTLLSDADLNIEEENDIMMQEGARRLAAVKKQQIAMAEIQGEAQVVMMKMQAKAQQAMQQAMQQPAAPGEPGGPQAQMSPQEAQQQAQATPPPQPPMLPEGTEGGGSSSVPGDAQSTLGLDQDLGAAPGQEQMPVDILQLAEGYAAQIAQLDPSMQEMALNAIAAQSQELADLVYEALSKIQQGDAGQSLLVGGAQGGPETGGVDMRPLPDKLPPRRVNALV
jgi:hypothetical protein